MMLTLFINIIVHAKVAKSRSKSMIWITQHNTLLYPQGSRCSLQHFKYSSQEVKTRIGNTNGPYEDRIIWTGQEYPTGNSTRREVNRQTDETMGIQHQRVDWPWMEPHATESWEPWGVVCLFVGWLLNVPTTCKCISGTDLLRQFYMLPHWDRSCRSNHEKWKKLALKSAVVPQWSARLQGRWRGRWRWISISWLLNLRQYLRDGSLYTISHDAKQKRLVNLAVSPSHSKLTCWEESSQPNFLSLQITANWHAEIEAANQTFYLSKSQHTDTLRQM